MNKSFYSVVLITFLGLSTFSCTEDIIDAPMVPDPPVTTEEVLSINPVIASIQPVSRGIITDFTDNDKIGLFLTNGELGDNYQGNTDAYNAPASYFQGVWQVEKKIPVTAQGTTFAYYPYSDKVNDGSAVPVEITSQTDYLYARKAMVDEKNPVAQIGMQHALSLVSVRIRKNDYQHAGKLTKVELLDVRGTGTLNIASGEVTNTGSLTAYAVDRNIVLDDTELLKTQMIMLPTVVADAGNIRLQITIDGKYYTWDIPKAHIWEAGKEYTYTLNLSKTPDELPDLELDVDYWTKYGKDDNITIEDHTQPGSEYFRLVDVINDGGPYGKTIVQGETYIFTGCLYAMRQGFKGRIKYSLWQGDRLVEQYPSYYFECEYWMTLEIPCFITCAPGIYQLKMLLQEEGKNAWILPPDKKGEERDWVLTVQADNKVPSVKSMNMEGYPSTYNTIRYAKLNQPFSMEFTMTNRAGIPLKGEIKAVWHRTFTGEFYAMRYSDGNTWEEEVGKMSIDIPANVKEYKDKILCCIKLQRSSKKYVESISFYYRAEGASNWLLMRSDSDSELQRWKEADKDKIVNGSEEHPELSWIVQGGFNYQYVALE